MALFRKSRGRTPRSRGPFGAVFWVALAGFLALAGFGVQEMVTELRAGRWPQVPCEIQSSGIAESPSSHSPGFIATVRYTYRWEGRTYVSDQIRVKPELIHSDAADAEARAAKFPKGARRQCHVNPANPREAILESSPDYVLLAISPFLLVIWALTERVALADWFEQRRQRRRGSRKQPLTENRAFRRAKRRPLVVGVLGLAMSLVFAAFLWIRPWWQQQASRAWQQTPCTILTVGVLTETSHQGGRSYKPQVVYRYEFSGEPHKSSQLDFSADMDFNYARIRKLVAAYHAGETTNCFVNPAHSGQSVLLRRFRADPFFSLFTAGFLVLSGFLMLQGLPGLSTVPTVNPWETREATQAGETTLRPEIQPGPRLLLSLLGLASCLGLAVWLLQACWESVNQGGLDLVPLLYGCGAGVGVFFSAKYAWRYGRALRHRGPTLRLAPATITPGQPFTVDWEWPPDVRHPEFRLFLEGVEAVRVLSEIPTQHGPSRDEKTQEWIFFTLPLTRGEQPETSAFGQARAELPPLTMHSFEGLKTKILWRIRADFPAPGAWSRKYKVVVRPPNRPSASL